MLPLIPFIFVCFKYPTHLLHLLQRLNLTRFCLALVHLCL
jgi:hypothetical protein